MATSNFHCVNTSKYFTFAYDGDEYNSTAEMAENELYNKGWRETGPWRSGDRDLGQKTVEISYGGCYIILTVWAFCSPGYYAGAVFDFSGTCDVYDNNDALVGRYDVLGDYAADAGDVTADNWTGNGGLSKIHAKNIIKKLYKSLDELMAEAESVFNEYSDEKLTVCARFSNGETLYQRA